ncbi:MAG TPA: hypothetical protein PLP24_09630 [Acetivibrio thermocellus]|nr:hypothetical protein [Acetivibrio thermocellus]
MGDSWSGVRKRLEQDLLCDALKGRLKYFITKYNNAHDESGRVAIIVDGREIIQGDIFRYYKGYREVEKKIKSELGIPKGFWDGKRIVNDEVNREVEEYIDKIRLNEGIFDVWQFTDAVERFLNSNIKESLVSENPLVRLLAIVDRRVGKRTLEKLKDTVSQQPEWLQYFYRLRLQAESII